MAGDEQVSQGHRQGHQELTDDDAFPCPLGLQLRRSESGGRGHLHGGDRIERHRGGHVEVHGDQGYRLHADL